MGYKMKGIKDFGEGTPLFQKKKKAIKAIKEVDMTVYLFT